ncbi:hypothetical protein B296_00043100 [Ensete ventricosum]|uniref:Uncharacterized protein n=1 Tax=Ensete ventricosum TaxID=4639 RepID=A0A426XXH6_ENSVE|nr:hypothetical protein B296_00043100 [Ensete ventricosum]
MRTARYRAVPPIVVVSTPLPPKIERRRGEKKKREKREEKNLETSAALRSHDPLPVGDFFSSCREKRLPMW